MKQLTSAVLFGIILINTLHAQNPTKVAEIYETHAFTVDNPDHPVLVPATLTVRTGTNAEDPPVIDVEIDSYTTAPLVRFPPLALPPEYAHLLEDELLLDTSQHNRHGQKIKFQNITSKTNSESKTGGTFSITVHDTTGSPAAGLHLEIKAGQGSNQIPLGTMTTPQDGKIKIHQPLQPDFDNPGFTYQHRPFSQIQITASDPTGQKQIIPFPSHAPQFQVPVDTENLYTALIASNSAIPAFRGKLYDTNGSPLGGAALSPTWIELPGRGGKQFWGQPKILTAPDGTFSFGIPLDYLEHGFGITELPTSTVLTVEVHNGTRARLYMDRENEIRLNYTENLTVQLLGPDGAPITTLKPNYSLNVDLVLNEKGETKQVSSKLLDAENAILALSNVPIPGHYGLRVNDWNFQPLTLNKGSDNQTITFRQITAQSKASGRVISAEDSQPISNAFIISSVDGGTPTRLMKLAPQELEEIWSQWQSGEITSPNQPLSNIKLKNGDTIFSVDAMARSDQNGHYSLTFGTGGNSYRTLNILTPDRLGAVYRIPSIQNATNQQIAIPDLALPYRATVQFKVIAPKEIPNQFLTNNKSDTIMTGKYIASTSVDTEKKWQAPLPDAGSLTDNKWSLINSSGWLSDGNIMQMAVQANAEVTVSLGGSHGSVVGHVNWTVGPLAPGTLLDLQDKPLPVKTPFLVVVKKSDGTPAAGVSVRIDGAMPLTTDAEGAVIGWSSGVVRSIDVLPDQGWDIAARKENIQINPAGEMTTIEMIIK